MLRTNNPIILNPGTTYTLSFDLIGSQRGTTTSTTVTFGPYTRTFVLASDDVTSGIVSVPITVDSPTQAYLEFDSNTPGLIGALLDNVLITAPPEALAVSPAFLDFRWQGDRTTSQPRTVVLTNTGALALSIWSIGTTGDFDETNDCGSSLAPGARCKVSVTFTPKMEGVRTGHLAFPHQGSGPQWIPLEGLGVPRS